MLRSCGLVLPATSVPATSVPVPSVPTMAQARTWCFTLNNPTAPLDFSEHEAVTYAVWQKEAGENGTPHYQGYIEMSKPSRLTAMKKIIPGAHFEKRRGTRDQARDYCMKEESRLDGSFEYGDFGAKRQGKRNDLVRLYESVKEGKPDRQILEEDPATYMRYFKAVDRVRLVIAPRRDFKTEVYVIWGGTGLGKSYFCRAQSPEAYWKQRGDWWDQYDGGSDVIIDDFYGWLKWDTLLRLCDENPCQVEIKGGHVNFAPKRIYITSNKAPSEWYSNEKCHFPTFARRVTSFMYFTAYNVYEAYPKWEEVLSSHPEFAPPPSQFGSLFE